MKNRTQYIANTFIAKNRQNMIGNIMKKLQKNIFKRMLMMQNKFIKNPHRDLEPAIKYKK